MMMGICQREIINLGGGFEMTNRLIDVAVLLLLGFTVFVCLAGFGMLIAVVFLMMHPVMIILGTVVSACLVLLYLMIKDNKAS